jgi:hypothetical protein
VTIVASDALRLPAEKDGEQSMTSRTVPMDTFKWIVSGLLGAFVLAVGWFLSDIRTDLRDMRKEVTAIRVEAAATNTRLESLLEDGRRRVLR